MPIAVTVGAGSHPWKYAGAQKAAEAGLPPRCVLQLPLGALPTATTALWLR